MHLNLLLKALKQIFLSILLILIFLAGIYLLSKRLGDFSNSDLDFNSNLDWLHHQQYIKNHKPLSLKVGLAQRHPSASDSRETVQCRNSAQSPDLVVDQEGVVCSRKSLLANGCCAHKSSPDKPPPPPPLSKRGRKVSTEGIETRQFVCESCVIDKLHCCSIFEHCVSCCLQPTNHLLWQVVIDAAIVEKNRLLISSPSAFDFCLRKCRTSSKSVLHENAYRNPSLKFCFGSEQPSTVSPLLIN